MTKSHRKQTFDRSISIRSILSLINVPWIGGLDAGESASCCLRESTGCLLVEFSALSQETKEMYCGDPNRPNTIIIEGVPPVHASRSVWWDGFNFYRTFHQTLPSHLCQLWLTVKRKVLCHGGEAHSLLIFPAQFSGGWSGIEAPPLSEQSLLTWTYLSFHIFITVGEDIANNPDRSEPSRECNNKFTDADNQTTWPREVDYFPELNGWSRELNWDILVLSHQHSLTASRFPPNEPCVL